MIDLQKIIIDKINSMVEEGQITNRLEEGIQKAIYTSIDDLFGHFGKIQREIKKGLEEGLEIRTDNLPFETYNQQMLVALKEKANQAFAGEASQKFLEEIDKVLAPVPKEVHIKDMIETIIGFWKSEDYCDPYIDDYATVQFNEKENNNYSLYFWKQKKSEISHRDKSPDIRLFILNDKIAINHTHGYNPTILRDEDGYIFKLYSAGTTIICPDDFHIDDCDLSLKDEY